MSETLRRARCFGVSSNDPLLRRKSRRRRKRERKKKEAPGVAGGGERWYVGSCSIPPGSVSAAAQRFGGPGAVRVASRSAGISARSAGLDPCAPEGLVDEWVPPVRAGPRCWPDNAAHATGTAPKRASTSKSYRRKTTVCEDDVERWSRRATRGHRRALSRVESLRPVVPAKVTVSRPRSAPQFSRRHESLSLIEPCRQPGIFRNTRNVTTTTGFAYYFEQNAVEDRLHRRKWALLYECFRAFRFRGDPRTAISWIASAFKPAIDYSRIDDDRATPQSHYQLTKPAFLLPLHKIKFDSASALWDLLVVAGDDHLDLASLLYAFRLFLADRLGETNLKDTLAGLLDIFQTYSGRLDKLHNLFAIAASSSLQRRKIRALVDNTFAPPPPPPPEKLTRPLFLRALDPDLLREFHRHIRCAALLENGVRIGAVMPPP